MESLKKDFIYLLSCFLNGKNPESREYDWAGIYHLADINDVAAIVAFLIKSVGKDYQPDSDTHQYYKKSMAQAIASYEEKTLAYKYVTSVLKKRGIDFIALKGIVVRELYPVREFRTSGDIDLTVKKTQLETAYDAFKNENSKILAYNAGAFVFKADGVTVEIHDSADLLTDYFDDMFAFANGETLDEYSHLLYVLCHLVKHLAYRGAGVRMLMDIDVMIRSIEEFDCAKFFEMCEKAGVLKSAKVLLSLSKLWFGTAVETGYEISADLERNLETVLIDGGSFGYEMSFVPLKYLRKASSGGGELSSSDKVKIALSMAFPNREYLKKCYRYYEKHGALYPVAVANRLADSVFKKRKSSKGALTQIFTDPDSAAAQIELAKELGIGDE